MEPVGDLHRVRGALPGAFAIATGPVPADDAHKRTHTAVIVDANGRQLATKTCRSTSKDHLALLRWASKHGADRVWALEDCRNMTRRLEQTSSPPANAASGSRRS